MASDIDTGKAGDLQDGQMKKLEVDGREVLLARVEGKYYALGNRCPHMGGDLSKGRLEGTVVTCPLHGSRFDVRDGQLVRWTDWTGVKLAVAKVFRSPRPARSYEVRQGGDSITVVAPESERRAA